MENAGKDSSFTYDVYLSFRGEDTRFGFTKNLHDALIQREVKTFMDVVNLDKGEEIDDALLGAIDSSKIAIIVFSRNYANSSWCLIELAKIIECKDRRGMMVIPVFYYIEPTIIRKQTSSYGEAMALHEERFKDDKEKVQQWRTALARAASISGWDIINVYEVDLIRNIIEDVSKKLKALSSNESRITTQETSQGHAVKNGLKRDKRVSDMEKSDVAFDSSHMAAATAAKASLKDSRFSDKENLVSSGNSSISLVHSQLSHLLKDGVGKLGWESEKEKNSRFNEKDDLVSFGSSSRLLSMEDLLSASAEVLGKGSFGTAYKVVLEIGTVLAMKELKQVTLLMGEFEKRIQTIGAMEHENLVRLKACYTRSEKKLLFYDYMPMRSLAALLHGSTCKMPFNWEMRLGIAYGAALGIQYLHSRGPTVCHGNIKSSNILLTKSYEAKISDFCLPLLAINPSYIANHIAGYHAPEIDDLCKVSQKSDVYSFGVLLMEIVSGKDPTRPLMKEEELGLPKWIQSIAREDWLYDVVHAELLTYFDVGKEISQLLQLALECTTSYPDNRPSMSKVTKDIEKIRPRLRYNSVKLDDSFVKFNNNSVEGLRCSHGRSMKLNDCSVDGLRYSHGPSVELNDSSVEGLHSSHGRSVELKDNFYEGLRCSDHVRSVKLNDNSVQGLCCSHAHSVELNDNFDEGLRCLDHGCFVKLNDSSVQGLCCSHGRSVELNVIAVENLSFSPGHSVEGLRCSHGRSVELNDNFDEELRHLDHGRFVKLNDSSVQGFHCSHGCSIELNESSIEGLHCSHGRPVELNDNFDEGLRCSNHGRSVKLNDCSVQGLCCSHERSVELKENFDEGLRCLDHGHSLKLNDNSVQGLCYSHGRSVELNVIAVENLNFSLGHSVEGLRCSHGRSVELNNNFDQGLCYSDHGCSSLKLNDNSVQGLRCSHGRSVELNVFAVENLNFSPGHSVEGLCCSQILMDKLWLYMKKGLRTTWKWFSNGELLWPELTTYPSGIS